MRRNHFVWILSMLLCAAPSFAVTPEQFMAELKTKSPQHDGAPLRTYRTEDLNKDKQPEVLEITNPIDEESTGLLNIELAPAFEWIDVYQKQNDGFALATEKFSEFLKTRRAFYVEWLKKLENPAGLNADSQQLIRSNLQQFQETLNRFIGRIDCSLNGARPNKSLKPTNPRKVVGK